MQSPNCDLAKNPIYFRRCHKGVIGIAGFLCTSVVASRLTTPMRTAGDFASAGIETLGTLTAEPQ